MKRFGIFLVGATVALATSAMAADNHGPSAARGKQIFMRDGCWECHGTVGQGGAGAKLAPDPLPLEAMANFVHNTTGAMPAYSAQVLPDSDIADIHAYLASIPKPPSPDTIALLKNLKETK